MSNKTKQFKTTWIIEAEGSSRKFPEDELSFQEEMIEAGVRGVVTSIRTMYKTIKIKYTRT